MIDIQRLNEELKGLDAAQVLKKLTQIVNDPIVFSTSFQLEDQIITHFIATEDLNIEIFTIDTGRHFPETYKTWEKTLERYSNIKIRAYFPDTEDVEKLLTEKGPFSFYKSVENRKECCYIRKVKPLERALAGKAVWITGLRSGQGDTRQNVPLVDWDKKHQVVKINPLHDWTLEQVRKFINDNLIPYNELHDRGYPSIGCQPCTRAIKPGEPLRAGRWWWEQNAKKECGLHVQDEDFSNSVKINKLNINQENNSQTK